MSTTAFAHKVEKGDTMSEIAQKYNMSLNELAELNPHVSNLNLIYVGQEINTDGKQLTETAKVVEKTITTKNNVVEVNSNEIDLLARLVYAEARGESYQGKVAVAEVVLNRVNNSKFPNSIKDVIYQSGQFSPVSNGSINKSADEESKQAALEAINSNTDITGGALFFYNAKTASSRWLDGKQTTTVIGSHTFKY